MNFGGPGPGLILLVFVHELFVSSYFSELFNWRSRTQLFGHRLIGWCCPGLLKYSYTTWLIAKICVCEKKKSRFTCCDSILLQESPPTWTGPGGGTYLGWGVPTLARGYLPWSGGRYLPGYPRVWTDKQTETITFPYPTDAGGNNNLKILTFGKGRWRGTFLERVLSQSYTMWMMKW